MADFIDEHRDEYPVEPICAVFPIAPSTYYACTTRVGSTPSAVAPGPSNASVSCKSPLPHTA